MKLDSKINADCWLIFPRFEGIIGAYSWNQEFNLHFELEQLIDNQDILQKLFVKDNNTTKEFIADR